MLNVANAETLSTYVNSIVKSQRADGMGMPFREVLANAQSAAPDAQDPAAAANAAAVAALGAALSQFGISTPPAIRVTSGPNGYELSGDSRNDKFQAMLKADPAVQNMLGGLINQQVAARKSALDKVVSDFQGKSGNGGLQSFLDDFMRSEKTDTYSLSFNGAKIEVDELGDKGWQPVKDAADFTRDLIAAYTQYQITHGVTVEKQKDKDDSDESLHFRAKLADAMTRDDGVAG
ncbi:hypothetical protein [Herbaspirillum sp. RV1423]|uniref:hypothetical protein n=1 Tax=Herbaspirillum sp. RV1423 TaxID=1443993 RepID=UPI0004AD169A|nr:hypothetical protein [Herbaspirillum sp. RV1423]